MTTTVLEDKLRELRDRCGAEASAVVSRDGLIVAGDMPTGIARETFSIMCATILGAALTTATELGKAPPRRIVLEGEDTRIIIFEAGRRAMLVLVVPPERDVDEVQTASADVIQAAQSI